MLTSLLTHMRLFHFNGVTLDLEHSQKIGFIQYSLRFKPYVEESMQLWYNKKHSSLHHSERIS
jgi:hypothetical protein